MNNAQRMRALMDAEEGTYAICSNGHIFLKTDESLWKYCGENRRVDGFVTLRTPTGMSVTIRSWETLGNTWSFS